MARFDVYEDALKDVDYLLDVQADFHNHLSSRIVIPLKTREQLGESISRLYVPLMVSSREYFAVTPFITVVPKGQLGRPIGNVADQSHSITAAIDFLFQGF